MPVYEYKCLECGIRVEILVRSSNQQPDLCPECGSPGMEKCITAPAAILKSKEKSGGSTCCGRDERCEAPPCSSGGSCRREQ